MLKNALTQRLIAKSARDGSHLWLPLTAHLTDTGEVALRLWDRWLPDGVKRRIVRACGGDAAARRLVHFLGLTHDIGKASPDFQRKILDGMRRCNPDAAQAAREMLEGVLTGPLPTFGKSLPHALMSQWIAKKNGCNEGIASILGAHHGKACEKEQLCDLAGHTANIEGKPGCRWPEVQKELWDWALKQAGYADSGEIPEPEQSVLVLLTGLTIIADWMASNDRWCELIPLTELTPEASSAQRAERAWKRADLPTPWRSDADALEDVSMLYSTDRYGFDTPTAMQVAALECVMRATRPGIFILEGPMGCGKTETALAMAEILCAQTGRSGVFFALPTQATSNGIFPRLKRWAEAISREERARHAIRLVHAAAHLNEDSGAMLTSSANISEDEAGGVSVHSWFEGSKKALLADFVVGTVDQLLMAALNRRHVMLRHVGLAGKVAIVDECHAYDAYMNQYLDRALAWLSSYGVPVIILSATLPPARRKALLQAYAGSRAALSQETMDSPQYPLLTWSDGVSVQQCALPGDGRTTGVELRPLAYDALDGAVAEIMQGGGCLGIVVNTVRAAQELTQRLTSMYPGSDVRLLHARFLSSDRVQKEAALLDSLGKAGQRPEWCIVVGTQVIEQSLDIDFDVLITEICPMDLLLQRIGRLHRHRRTRPAHAQTPRCYVLGARETLTDASRAVYDPWLLMKTQSCLPEWVMLPTDIPILVQQVYAEPEVPERLTGEWAQAWKESAAEQERQRQKAKVFLVPEPDFDDTLTNWQVIRNTDSDHSAEAAVRDGRATLEVIALQLGRDGTWNFLGSGQSVPPLQEQGAAGKIAGQRLRLPSALCTDRPSDRLPSGKIIEQLEAQTLRLVSEWQQSPLLRGELLLTFDADAETKLNGYRLRYSAALGLQYEKEETDG